MSRYWIDKYGTIWEKIRGDYVWNRFTGKGLWDNGKGLTPYYGEHTRLWKEKYEPAK